MNPPARAESDRYPYLPIRLAVAGAELAFEALLDTGLDGDVVVPEGAIPGSATPRGTTTYQLGDGSLVRAPWYTGTLRIGELAAVRVAVTVLGPEHIVGRGVAARYAVLLDRGRRVVVEP